MSFRLGTLTGILFVVCVAFVTPAGAQDLSPQRLKKLHQRFPQADLNGDGTLTKEEELEAMQRFQNRPRNKNQQRPDLAPKPTHENVKYGDFARNVLDLWIPESEKPTALIVHIHGDGFVGGDKASVRKTEIVQHTLDSGVAFGSINYRYR